MKKKLIHKPALLWLWPEATEQDPALLPFLTSWAKIEVANLDQAALIQTVGRYDALVPRLTHEIDLPVLNAANKLRIIGTPSTGSDHIAVDIAAQRNIHVVTIKDDRAFLDRVQATAELAWLLILACNRNMRQAIDHVLTGSWQSGEVRGHEMIDRTLGIVGYGRLGSMMSRFAHAFRMNVIATDPTPITDPWVTQLPLEQLLDQADIITLHVHLNRETHHLIGPDEFAKMKQGAYLVNTSRGGVIDQSALLEALNTGHLGGAGLDVIDEERSPNRMQSPLLKYAAVHDNLLITPHVGGCTYESQNKAFMHFAVKLKAAWQSLDQ